jgi:membrane-associated protease RseP (regulator of RpoE activity)
MNRFNDWVYDQRPGTCAQKYNLRVAFSQFFVDGNKAKFVFAKNLSGVYKHKHMKRTYTQSFIHSSLCGRCGKEDDLFNAVPYFLTNNGYIKPMNVIAYNVKALVNLSYSLQLDGGQVYQMLLEGDKKIPVFPASVAFLKYTGSCKRDFMWRRF